MIKLYFLLFILISHQAFSDSFIIKKDGTKSEIRSNSFKVDAIEKQIYFKLIDQEKQIKMHFKDFDYVVFGNNKFQTFRLNNSTEVNAFFVLAETSDKTLISISIPDLESEESTKISYVFHVLDKQNNLIESYEFNNIQNQKNANVRSEIYNKIKFYFSGCELLMNRLNYFDRNINEINNTAILGFFNAPVYVSCL